MIAKTKHNTNVANDNKNTKNKLFATFTNPKTRIGTHPVDLKNPVKQKKTLRVTKNVAENNQRYKATPILKNKSTKGKQNNNK